MNSRLIAAHNENIVSENRAMTIKAVDNLLGTQKFEETEDIEATQRKAFGAEKKMKRQVINLISANIHPLRPRADIIAEWEADIMLLQEQKLAPHAIVEVASTLKQYGWTVKHGKPCQGQKRRKDVVTTYAAYEANSGAVAAMAKMPNNCSTTIHKTKRQKCTTQGGGLKPRSPSKEQQNA